MISKELLDILRCPLDPARNAFRTTLAEQALAEADTVSAGGPLAGVPVAIKDDLPIAGQVTTRGSKTHGPPAAEDAIPPDRIHVIRRDAIARPD